MKSLTSITAAAAAGILAGCSGPAIKGDGIIKTESRVISDFSTLQVAGGYEIHWSTGKPALTITTDQNLLPLINTTVSGSTLTIDSKSSLSPTKGTTITLAGSSLAEVRLTGGTTLVANGLTGRALKLDSTGAAEITVDGSVDDFHATLTGASELRAKGLRVRNATLSLTGASDAKVNVTDDLKASITGAGSVTYSGNPKVEQHISGAGSIQRE